MSLVYQEYRLVVMKGALYWQELNPKLFPFLLREPEHKRNWDLEIPQPNHPASIYIYINKNEGR